MQATIRNLFVAACFLLAAIALEAETVIVADIEDRTGQLKPEVLEASRGLLEQAYRGTGKHRIVAVDGMRKYVAGQKKWKDCFQMECQLAAAGSLKADLVVTASVDFFAGIYTMTVSTITVKNKQKNEAGAADFNGTAVGMKTAVEKLAPALTGKKMAAAPAPAPTAAPATIAAPVPAVTIIPVPIPAPSAEEKKYQGTNFKEPVKETYTVPAIPKEPELKKIPKGNVTFTSPIAAVKIAFAKGKKEEKNCALPCSLNTIDPGDYVVRFEKEGYIPREEVVRIEADKTVTKNIELSPLIADKAQVNEELIAAAKEGDLKEMNRLFVLGADANYHNPAGYSALLVASLSGQNGAAEHLINKGARFTAVEIGTLLLMVVETNNIPLLKLMLKQKADLNYRYDNGRTILWHAIERQRWSIFDQLVKAKIDTGIKDNSGMNILMWTIDNGMEKVAQMLKNYGLKLEPGIASKALRNVVSKENVIKLRTLLPFVADLNPVYEDGLTPLWYAAIKGRTDIVDTLLAAGANPDVRDKNKKSLLTYSIETRKFDIANRLIDRKIRLTTQESNFLIQKGVAIGDSELVRVVLKAGGNVNQKFDDGMTAVWVAAFNNNREMVSVLAAAGANLNSKDKDGRTILMWAVENNRKELAQVALANGANVNLLDNRKRTALSIAIEKNNLSLVDVLVRNKAQVNLKDDNGNTPLLIATATGNLPMVQVLLDGGAGVNSDDKNGNTPLIIGVHKGYGDIVRILIDKGADLNKANREKKTPVHIAAMRGEKELLELLVEKGAEMDKPDATNATPLLYAKRDNRYDIVGYLLQKNAKITSREEMEELFVYACQNGFDPIVANLIERKVDINRRFADGYTPLWLAVMSGNDKIVKMLAAAGADIEARDKEGMTPLLYATAKKEENVVLALLNLGAEIGAKDKGLNTALHYCASRGFVQSAAILIRKGASLNDKDDKGRSPMVRAQFTGNYDIVDMLKRAGAYE